MTPLSDTPRHASYDVVIIGGAIMGSSTAWWLTQLGFDGRVLVVERDPGYEACSTAHTNSCIRQQFSEDLNIRLSQFTAEFIGSLSTHIGDDRAPDLKVQNYGYLYLADTEVFVDVLRRNQKVQRAAGAEPTRVPARGQRRPGELHDRLRDDPRTVARLGGGLCRSARTGRRQLHR